MVDRPANQAPEEASAVYGFYARKNNTTNNFVQIPENEVAHAVGLSGSDKGKTFYVDSNGKIAKLAPGGDEDVIGFLNGVPTTVAGASAALEITKEFVATGTIADGVFVALRSDGTVEAVTGTETLAAIGSDATLTAVTSMRFLDGEYNATSGKIACLFYDVGASRTMYLVIGTVSGNTITFGSTQTFTGGTGATYWTDGRIVWNAAGTQVFVAFQGASGYQSFVSATVSGTVMTFGSVVQNGTVSWAGSDKFFDHDDTNTKLIFRDDGSNNNVAATYSGTTITLGTSATFTCTGDQRARYYYDETNQRFTAVGSSTNCYVLAATLSGTTWTVGTEVSSSAVTDPYTAFDPTSGKIVLLGVTSPTSGVGLPYAAVVTFSGANATINTATKVGDYSIINSSITGVRASLGVYEPTSGKVCFAVRMSDTTGTPLSQADLMMFVGTISGTSVSFATPVAISSANITVIEPLLARGSNSEIAIVVTEYADYGRQHVITGKISSGVFVVKDDTLMRSVPASQPRPTGSGISASLRRKNLMASWNIINLNEWGPSGTSATATIFGVTLPTESTNADDWIGVAREAATNGNTLSVRLAGGIDDERSGLTPETDYYLKGDGTLITTDNGRYAGRALSATSMLLRAL